MDWPGKGKGKTDTGHRAALGGFPMERMGISFGKDGNIMGYHGGYFMIFHGANAANANDDLLGGFDFNGRGRLQLRCTEPV